MSLITIDLAGVFFGLFLFSVVCVVALFCKVHRQHSQCIRKVSSLSDNALVHSPLGNFIVTSNECNVL